jgi:hypothetical protein
MALGGLTLVSFYKSIQIHLRKKELEEGEIKERLVESREIWEDLKERGFEQIIRAETQREDYRAARYMNNVDKMRGRNVPIITEQMRRRKCKE